MVNTKVIYLIAIWFLASFFSNVYSKKFFNQEWKTSSSFYVENILSSALLFVQVSVGVFGSILINTLFHQQHNDESVILPSYHDSPNFRFSSALKLILGLSAVHSIGNYATNYSLVGETVVFVQALKVGN